MAGEIAYKLTAEEKQAVDAIRKVAQAFNDVEGGVKKVSEETKRLEREQAEMGRLAKRVMEEAKTPLDRYAEQMDKLNQLVEQGKIPLTAYEAAAKKAGKELEDAGKAAREAFGPAAVDSMLKYVGGLVSLASAIAAVKQGFAEMSRIKSEAAQHTKESEFGYGALAEVSGGDKVKFQKNVAMARHIAASAGMSENQATKLTFALSSAEMMGEADTFSNAYKQGVVRDPENLLRSSNAMRKAFGGRMSGKNLLNIAFGAGEASPSKANELLAASAGAAAYAQGTGTTEQELLAGTAVNATVLDPEGGAARGGTAMKALMKAIVRATGPQEAAPAYSEEEFQKDKENLSKERTEALAEAKRVAKHDPQYLEEVRSLEVEKARLSKVRRGSPEAIAERQMRLREISQAEQEALQKSEQRTEQSDKFKNISSTFKLKEDELIARRKASAAGIATDDEGNVLDDETKKIRQAVSAAMRFPQGNEPLTPSEWKKLGYHTFGDAKNNQWTKNDRSIMLGWEGPDDIASRDLTGETGKQIEQIRKARSGGPNLISRLKAIEGMKLSDAQLIKFFGRSEGFVAYKNILAQEKEFGASVDRQDEALRVGLFDKVLALPSTDEGLQGAKLSRIGESKKLDSDRDLGTQGLVYEAALAHRYSKRGIAGKAIQNISEGALNWIPGRKKIGLSQIANSGELEDDPELYAAAVKQAGGEESVFGRDEDQVGYGARDRVRTHQRYRKIMGESVSPEFREDTKDLEAWKGVAERFSAAVDKFEQAASGNNRPALGTHKDPGDRH